MNWFSLLLYVILFLKSRFLALACNKAEDRVDILTKDLLLTRRRLKATEEVKRGKEEEATMVRTTSFTCLSIE